MKLFEPLESGDETRIKEYKLGVDLFIKHAEAYDSLSGSLDITTNIAGRLRKFAEEDGLLRIYGSLGYPTEGLEKRSEKKGIWGYIKNIPGWQKTVALAALLGLGGGLVGGKGKRFRGALLGGGLGAGLGLLLPYLFPKYLKAPGIKEKKTKKPKLAKPFAPRFPKEKVGLKKGRVGKLLGGLIEEEFLRRQFAKKKEM